MPQDYKGGEHHRTSTYKEENHPATSAGKKEDIVSLTDNCIRICETLADELEDLNIKAAKSLIELSWRKIGANCQT